MVANMSLLSKHVVYCRSFLEWGHGHSFGYTASWLLLTAAHW